MLKYLSLLIFLSPWTYAGLTTVADCRLLTDKGMIIMTFPGKRCAFLDDGTVISLGKVELRRFGSDGQLLWENNLASSESTFTLSREGNFLLTLAEIKGKLPFDHSIFQFRIYDLNGALVRQTDTVELFGAKEYNRVTDFGEAREGEFFVNLFQKGMYFLDKDLKQILRVLKFPGTHDHNVKNVLATEKGSFVFLEYGEKTVSLKEYTPETRRTVKRYPPGEGASFYFPYGGSLALSQDTYVINHPFAGTFVVSRKSGKIEDFFVESHVTDTLRPPRNVSLRNLQTFFTRWNF